MPNLIESFGLSCPEPRLSAISTIDAAIRELNAALDFLYPFGFDAVQRAATTPVIFGWGSTVKRIRVVLPVERRPLLLLRAEPDHSMIEVINQCATVERLLDALTWAKETSWGDWSVERCHPTTGNRKHSRSDLDGDNDLVLKGATNGFARFEVADISGVRDTNRSIRKNLRSLGIGSDLYGKDAIFLVLPAPPAVMERPHCIRTFLNRGTRGVRVRQHPIGRTVVAEIERTAES